MGGGLRRRYGAARVQGPSSEQLEVLRTLATDPDRRLVRIPGGFWTTPVLASTWDQHMADAQRAPWHTAVQTVRAMERRGWLARTGHFPEEWRDDRALTDAGSALAGGS